MDLKMVGTGYLWFEPRLGIEVNGVAAEGFRAGIQGSNLLIFFWF